MFIILIDKKKEHREWNKIIARYAKETRHKKYIKRVLKTLGVALAIVGGIVVILGLPCIGIIGVGSIHFIVPCCVAVHASAAGGVLLGGALCSVGYCLNNESIKQLEDISNKTTQIRDSLRIMVFFGEEFKDNIGNLNNTSQSIETFTKQINDPNITQCNSMLFSAKEILKYLIEYQKNGKEIVEKVKASQRVFVDVWKNMAL